jgi:hypothetical protein
MEDLQLPLKNPIATVAGPLEAAAAGAEGALSIMAAAVEAADEAWAVGFTVLLLAAPVVTEPAAAADADAAGVERCAGVGGGWLCGAEGALNRADDVVLLPASAADLAAGCCNCSCSMVPETE